MRIMLTIPALLFGFIVWQTLPQGAPAALAGQGCITAQCHPKMLKGKTVHPVAEACESCHQASLTPHPQKKKKTFTLVQEPPGLCNQCHPPRGTMKHVHAPVKGGMCTSCHNPHDSNHPKLLVQPAGELCATCHADKLNYKYLHGPTATGDCLSCHSPHESQNPKLVVKQGLELCFSCHVDFQAQIKKKYVHSAMKGECSSCHNPHGSAEKKLLAAEGEKLCFQCHPKIQQKIEKSKVAHKPVSTEKGCASCHNPHASDAEKLLPQTGKDLCLGCHPGVIKKEQTIMHGPIKNGACIPCHDPHSSPYPRLLEKEYDTELYVSYTDTAYDLCFSCHNRDLLRYPTTSYATGFRDGEKNLHYVHVNRKEKGRNCKACHLVHASESPKLIADHIPFGKWSLPLRFTKTETGGSCAPGCHQKYTYDRKTPGKAPEQPGKTKDKRGKQ